MMIRACICLLAGILAPQLTSFPRYSDLFPAPLFLVDHSIVISGAVILIVSSLALLPRGLRLNVICFAGGIVLFQLHAEILIHDRLSPRFTGDSLLTTLRVVDFPSRSGDGMSFLAVARDDLRIPSKIRLSWYEPPVAVYMGDIWSLEIRLKPPRGSSNPGSMDFEAWLFRERIGATGYVVNSRHSRLLDSGTSRGVMRLRVNFVQRVRRLVADPESAAVLVALVVGARHLITADQWDRYARTGTSHLIAISGLHIGLAAVGSYLIASLCLGFCSLRSNHHDLALIVACALAATYAVVSGFAVPAQRAVLMLGLAMLAVLSRRQIDALAILGIVAAGVGFLDPISTMTPGFKLSFAAVALLVWLSRRQVHQGHSWLLRPLVLLQSLGALQIGLLMGLMPLTVLIFDRVSLLAPLLNLVAVPLFSVITVPCALLGFLADGPAAWLGDPLLQVSAWTVHWLNRLLSLGAGWEYSAMTVAERTGPGWLYVFVPLLWVLLPGRWPGRPVAWLGAVALLAWRPPGPGAACIDITMLDVGQGLAAVLRTRDHVALYDTGPVYRSGASAGKRVLLPYLKSQGIGFVDRVIVSHSDLDHAGGLEDMLAETPVGLLESGDALPWIASRQSRCAAGNSWEWNLVKFKYLYPPAGQSFKRNNASCVLLVEAGDHRYLLSGDIEAEAETQLIQARRLPEVSVASVPHHGSRTSSLRPFVLSLLPDYALVSAAFANQWGFPKEDVVARWRGAGAEVLNTATSGAISVRMCAANSAVEIRQNRKTFHRLWHAEP